MWPGLCPERQRPPQLGPYLPSTWGIVWPSLSAPPTCTQVCLYLVAEILDLQGVGLAAVGEVQAVVSFRGEHTVLEALRGDMTERVLRLPSSTAPGPREAELQAVGT